ncbi:MAG: cytochrome c [Lentisphaeraceae bacterium]|nr:cytochrome c [Lentisphaeraceae bacterium]
MIKNSIFLLGFWLLVSVNANNDESIQRGKKIYETVCFACHGKNLEGGSGFNLRDTVWVHGGTPSEILKTIKKGFPEKGMIPFETVFKENDLKDVVNFILSRQQGFKNLSYKIFQNLRADKPIEDLGLSKLKPEKSGVLKLPYLDINLPEVDWFGIQNSGILVIPESGEYLLKGILRQGSHIQMLIDGKPLKLDIQKEKWQYTFEHKVELKKGEHDFELNYVKIHKKASFHIELEKDGMTMPLSKGAFIKSQNRQIVIASTTKPVILRKRIDGLPSKTIAVAFPEKVNVAINPRNASINGLWYGEFVDIGPNVFGRGRLASLVKTPYIFSGDEGITVLENTSKAEVDYLEYSTYPQARFHFKVNDKKLSIEMTALGESLILTYRSESKQKLSLQVPEGVTLESLHGQTVNNTLIIDPKHNEKFTVKVTKKETGK